MRTLALCLPLLFSATALAAVPAEHDIVLTGDFAVSYQHITSSAGSGSINLFRLAPSFDWVATGGLTVGAWLVYEHLDTSNGGSSSSADDYGIIPRIGYAAELGPKVFIWPRFGIGYLHGAPDLLNLPVSSGESTINRVQIDIDLPILFVPIPHIFIGGGPLVRVDLSSSAGGVDSGKLTAFGLTTMVGGYF